MEWNCLPIEPLNTTKLQRKSLYRLGYSRWLVGKLDRESASRAIERGLATMREIKGKSPEMSK